MGQQALTCKRPKCTKWASFKNTGYCRDHYDAVLNRQAATEGYGRGYRDSEKVHAHLASLREAGLGYKRIGELSGVDRRTIQRIVKSDTVSGRVEAKLLSVDVPAQPHLVSLPSAKIDATGTRRRLQALAAIGYHYEGLADRLGMDHSNIWRLATGYKPLVYARVAREVDELFQKLQLTPAPPSQGAMKAINRAKKNGWPLPLSWDEDSIDNPNATPQFAGERVDWFDEFEALRDMGIPAEAAAERLGVKWDTVKARLRRKGQAA